MFANRVRYGKKGWVLDADADIEYRSHCMGYQTMDPNAWISSPAHNIKTGKTGKVWWYWPKSRRDIEDGADWVKDWDKCNDVEIYDD